VDRLLEELGRTELDLALAEGALAEQLYDLVAKHRDALAEIKTRKASIESAIEAFCQVHKSEFAKKRHKQLTWGRIAFRVASRVVVPKGMQKVIIATLRKLGFDDCVKVEETIDKQALKKLSETDLVKCGARLAKSDHFRIEPNLELIAEQVGRPYGGRETAIDMDKLDELLGGKAA
jgi:phage host-nuclease inhibitor protein Gam